jgi:menaquinone-9 beta-reductase
MNSYFDVIIVGAGPSGLICGKHLVDNGIKTLIIEKKKLPRFKCCGGLLSKRSVETLAKMIGDIPENIICKNRNLQSKMSKRGMGFILNPDENWLNVHRKEFDSWILNECKAEIIDESFFLDYEVNDDETITVIIKQKNITVKYTCRTLIAADGGFSRIRFKNDATYRPENMIVFKQNIYDASSSIDDNFYYFITSNKYSDLFSCFCVKDKLVYIATSFFLNKKNDRYNYELTGLLAKEFNLKIHRLERTELCISENNRNHNGHFFFGTNNILHIGESAGLITKYGEGLSSAVISGEIAVRSILESNNIYPARHYTKNIADEKKYIINSYGKKGEGL